LFRLAEKLDRDTASGELRLLVVSGELEREAAVSALARRLMPWSALVEAPPGKHTQRLRKLAAAARPRGPVLGLVALARALDGVGDAKQADRLLRAAVTAQPDQVVLLDARGKLLERQGPAHRPEAISCYRAVRAVRPLLGIALGMALLNEGRPAEAEEVFVDLRDRQRNNPEMSFYLGKALYEQKKLDEAATAFRKAVALQPDYALAHYGLGAALADQNKLAEAVAAFRKAIHLKSDFAYAYIYLGIALRKQKKLDEAVACYQQAIALQPDYALAYSNLGIVLRAQQKLDEAVAACRRAIQLQPDFADAYNNLGAALADQKKFDEAADAFRKAIQLQPDFAMAYNNLGAYLCDHQKKPAEAESLFRKAIALQPDLALAYYNLGNALRHQKKLVEAVAAYRRAIELQPDFAFPYANLGLALRDQKKLVEASTAFRKAHQLLPNDSRIRDDLHQTERWLELDKQLPLILAGKAKPSSPQGQMELALFCLDFKARYRAAVGFYAEAFATKPELADDLQAQHRYNAACAAALAAAGQGEDARRLPDKVILTLRRQALRWLRAELAAYARLAERDDPRLKQAVRQRLTHWQQDADLASVRDKEALDRLPHNEGGRWRKLWADVDMLLRKTQVIPR